MSTGTYSTGQAVEVRVPNFRAAGMPYVWVPAEVVEVEAVEGNVLSVLVSRRDGDVDRNGAPAIKRVMTTYRSRANLRPAS